MTSQPVLFIASKNDAVKDPKYVLVSFQEIERWAHTLTAGGFYASLTGAGETASPGDLTQTGGFTVTEDPSGTTGFNTTTFGGVQILDTGSGGITLVESGASALAIINQGGSGDLRLINRGGGSSQLLIENDNGGGTTITDTGGGGMEIRSNNGLTILDSGGISITETGSGDSILLEVGGGKVSVDNSGVTVDGGLSVSNFGAFLGNFSPGSPTTPTAGGLIYTAAGALLYIGSSGTVTTLAPA